MDDALAVLDLLRAELSLGATVTRFPTGSVPVFAVDDRYVVKLFPSDERAHFDTERAALARIDGSLSIPTPRLVEAGERGGWLFVVMTRLPGRSLAEAWPSIGRDDRRRLARAVGTGLAEMHAISASLPPISTQAPPSEMHAITASTTALIGTHAPPSELGRPHASDLGPLGIDWCKFMEAQRASARARQAAKGLESPWLEQVDDFLARWMPRDDGRRVLLHTEVMREHLLVDDRDGWRLTGLVDFEPAMVGAPEYELASVGVFVSCAEEGMLGAVLEGYGVEADDELPLRIMAYALLHRYSNLRWYLERLGAPQRSARTTNAEAPVGIDSIESLARSWFTP